MTPTLSVLISNYNHARFIPDSLGAIVNNTYRPHEIVIIDDASTDGSADVLEGYASRYPGWVRVLRNERNQGFQANVRRLLEMATGEYVCIPASDDRVLPDFFARSMALLESYPSAAVCSALSLIMNEAGVSEGLLRMPVVRRKPGYIDPDHVLKLLRKHGNWFKGNTTILRRSALMDAGGFRQELGPYADVFAYLVLARRWGACFIPEPLCVWRRMDNTYSNVMSQESERVLGMFQRAERLMRTDFADLFPPDYMEDWKREMAFGAAKAFARSADVSAVELFQHYAGRESGVDSAFVRALRRWPALGRWFGGTFLMLRFRPRQLVRALGRRVTYARLELAYGQRGRSV